MFIVPEKYIEQLDRANLVCSKIPKHKIDEIVVQLAYLSITLRRNYDSIWSEPHLWKSKRYDEIEEKGFIVGYIYIASNKFMPGLVKIGKTKQSPSSRVAKLSKGCGTEGVPGDFILEYARKSVIDYPIFETGINVCIEKTIHRGLWNTLIGDGYYQDENIDFENNQKEFFMVPSVKYAINFVDNYLDLLDRNYLF